jgi:hypothetical protein
LPDWAEVVLVEARDEHSLSSSLRPADRPVIAVRPLETPLDIVEARAACDALQRDLAAVSQFAGYIA